ncbi:MAG TPA: TonB-dependent receptor [Opitutaceae bacterium]
MRFFHAFAALALLPAAFGQVQVLDPMTVSATHTPEPVSEVPYTVEIVQGDAFVEGPSGTADDVLRDYPDFSLFRRNDSMTANPTSQGVSLRGLGPSGASRSLVLLDGVPLNDPFGGWVPWSLVPVDSLSGAEIVPGGGASIWGDESLAGVIELFTARPAPRSGDASLRVGDFDTRSVDIAQSVPAGPGAIELRAEDFSTGGTVLVAPQDQGPIDVDAASRHNLEEAAWRGTVGRDTGLVATLRRYDEWRDNGTPYQQNGFDQLFSSLALNGHAGSDATWDVTGYVISQDSWQTFSSVNVTRTAETPADDQFGVPTTALGLAATTTIDEPAGGRTTLGVDGRDIRGETREDYAYSNGAYADQRFAGGAQTFAGLFAEQSQAVGSSVHVVVGARVDRWENSDGHLRTSSIASGTVLSVTPYPTRAGTEFSPSAGVTWKAAEGLEFHVGAQRAFRVPTLNELYRPFRQGNTTTLANAALATEHADSAEVGAAWKKGSFSATADVFAARLENAVSNVTLAQGPGTFPLFGTLAAGAIGQERLNVGQVDTRGVELGVHWNPSDSFSVDISAIDEEAFVASAPVSPNIVGNTLPEVPRWNASAGVTWRPVRRLRAEVQVRWTGSEFDDDQNLLPLASAVVIDASLRFQLTRNAELFASAENLGDAQVETAHSALGVFNVAPPRIVEAGARLTW